ncbi:MAG: aminodeoxychorismate synthase component I [Bacteroidales bacterium]
MSNRVAIIRKMNELGSGEKPFVFIIDFEMKEPLLFPVNEINATEILFDINGITNYSNHEKSCNPDFYFCKFPLSYNVYLKAFDIVQQNLKYGNSYLVNLTFPTRIETDLPLRDIFFCSKAKYKLFYREKFVVFSPEIFVRISENGVISSFPMKGTIDAAIKNAENIILNDKKEYAEHCTIVDLIRNDLNIVAKDVYVEKFRYIDRIKTHEKELLQVSSQICGTLESDYHKHIGDIIFRLLPAGSISGAPKKKTVEIINEAEGYNRGYYTGVFGYFDGKTLDSGVMIRFIEKINEELYYKSGGGITVYSDPQKEYQELIDKVYVPFV